jgi:hypothetical protein
MAQILKIIVTRLPNGAMMLDLNAPEDGGADAANCILQGIQAMLKKKMPAGCVLASTILLIADELQAAYPKLAAEMRRLRIEKIKNPNKYDT